MTDNQEEHKAHAPRAEAESKLSEILTAATSEASLGHGDRLDLVEQRVKEMVLLEKTLVAEAERAEIIANQIIEKVQSNMHEPLEM